MIVAVLISGGFMREFNGLLEIFLRLVRFNRKKNFEEVLLWNGEVLVYIGWNEKGIGGFCDPDWTPIQTKTTILVQQSQSVRYFSNDKNIQNPFATFDRRFTTEKGDRSLFPEKIENEAVGIEKKRDWNQDHQPEACKIEIKRASLVLYDQSANTSLKRSLLVFGPLIAV